MALGTGAGAVRRVRALALADGRVRLVQLQEGAGPRVIAFPYAGAGAGVFRRLADALPGWSFAAVDPPGHLRTLGHPLRRVEELADLYLSVLPQDLFEGAVLLGVSVGGLVARELAARLMRRRVRPLALVMCATMPPAGVEEAARPKLSTLDDEALCAWLSGLGDAGRDVTRPELFEIFGPAIRADLEAFESYRATPALLPPELILNGSSDPLHGPDGLANWRQVDPGATIAILEGAGHYFVEEEPELLVARLAPFVSFRRARRARASAPP